MEFHLFTPLFWVGFAVLVVVLSHRRKMARIRMGLPERPDRMPRGFIPPQHDLSGADRRELEDLRERVKVLERIATDTETGLTRRQLAEEIEALRGK